VLASGYVAARCVWPAMAGRQFYEQVWNVAGGELRKGRARVVNRQ